VERPEQFVKVINQ